MPSLKKTFFIFAFFSLLTVPAAYSRDIKIATYNVENLFDLKTSGNEYAEYIPYNIFGWDEAAFKKKVLNISRVIRDMDPDIIGLQEIESEEALNSLQDALRKAGTDFRYHALAKQKNTVVRCCLLSKYPIIKTEELPADHDQARNILKTTVDINGHPLIIYVNHWKSKNGPESLRIRSARVLKKDLDKLDKTADFIIIGDFNSDYNEYLHLKDSRKLNDTKGKTGINHILNTVIDGRLVEEDILLNAPGNPYLYNLWLELPEKNRWSYNYKQEKNSPDSMIIGYSSYDAEGLSYADNSFERFAPDYLFKDNRIFRWQRSDYGHGAHKNSGFSDHLPIYAVFSTKPFVRNKYNYVTDTRDNQRQILDINKATIAQLINVKGIGKRLAIRIVSARPYEKIEDLTRVEGIGIKKLNEIKKYFTVGR